jgi:very-short-patch-repair endonuclease
MTHAITAINCEDQLYDLRIYEENDEKFYCASDIGKILMVKNIHENISTLSSKNKRSIKTMTPGGKQSVTFLTNDGLIIYISKSRNIRAQKIAEHFGINVINQHIVSIESSTCNQIMTAFKSEKMTTQFQVDKYRIDLYFNDYKLAIECDENHHIKQTEDDKNRELYIKEKLQCVFIRYNPQNKDFNIFEIINNIYTHIKNYNIIIELQSLKVN